MTEDPGYVTWKELEADMKTRPHCTCPGTNEEPWNPECVFHRVGHYKKPGCCDVAEDEDGLSPHRHMSSDEYNREFPKIFGERFQIDETWWMEVSARRYWDGIGLTITRQFHKDDPDSGGLCFDVDEAAIAPLARSLSRLADFIAFGVSSAATTENTQLGKQDE